MFSTLVQLTFGIEFEFFISSSGDSETHTMYLLKIPDPDVEEIIILAGGDLGPNI